MTRPKQWMRRSKPGFSRKLTLAFVAVIGVVALTLPVAVYAWGSIRAASFRSEASWSTLQQVGAFQQSLAKIRVSARDYADSSDRNDLERMVNELNGLDEQVRCIEKGCGSAASARYMPADEKAQWHGQIERIATANSEFRRLVRSGHPERAIREFDDDLQRDVGGTADRLAEAVRERGSAAQGEIRDSITQSAALLMGVLGVALGLALILSWWIPRSLMRRLDDLRVNAHLIAHGDLSARASEERLGKDEIADLVRDFNIMARSMQLRDDENQLLQQKLQIALMNEQERATRDPLTSLRNHRYFQEALAAEIDRATRGGRTVTIAMIDLDNFKQVNDRFGHHEGDAVLLRVTQGVSANLRPYDLACRLGGEEFGIIFPETDAAEAKLVLDRIAAHIVGFGPNGERATFSGGIATFPTHADNQNELFQRADESAYYSKGAGKAQCTIYDSSKVGSMNSADHQKQKSREAVLTTATTLVSAVDQKDPYTRNHAELTAIYAATLARAMNLDEETVKLVYRAALLHDVGKIGVADEILRKPGILDTEEWTQIRMHPEFSYRILEAAELGPVAAWTRHHHEHWDGSGYPSGISGDGIPLGSRIILVADAFEAMTSDRVYRRSLGVQMALQELASHAGTQFDPQVAQVMVHLVTNGVFDGVHHEYGKEPGAGMLMPVFPAQPMWPSHGEPPQDDPGQIAA